MITKPNGLRVSPPLVYDPRRNSLRVDLTELPSFVFPLVYNPVTNSVSLDALGMAYTLLTLTDELNGNFYKIAVKDGQLRLKPQNAFVPGYTPLVFWDESNGQLYKLGINDGQIVLHSARGIAQHYTPLILTDAVSPYYRYMLAVRDGQIKLNPADPAEVYVDEVTGDHYVLAIRDGQVIAKPC